MDKNFFAKFGGQAENTAVTLLFTIVMLSGGTPGQSPDSRTKKAMEHLEHPEHLEHAEHLEHLEHLEHAEHLEHLGQRFNRDRQPANARNAVICLFTGITGLWYNVAHFFSKTAAQGHNAAVNLTIATFILFHLGAVQEWYKRNKEVGTAGQK